MPFTLPPFAAFLSRLSMAAALALPAGVALAQPGPPSREPPPDSRPADQDRGPRGGREDREDRRDEDARNGRRERPDRPAPTAEEWEQSRAFLAEHSPQRLSFFEKLQEFAAARAGADGDEEGRWSRLVERVQSRLHARVSDIRELRDREPAHFEFAVAQYEAEDVLMAKLWASREAQRRGARDEAEAARREAREAAASHVQRALREREQSVERMASDLAEQQKRLEAEQQRLEKDRGRVDELQRRLVERYERRLPPPGPSTRPGDDDGDDE